MDRIIIKHWVRALSSRYLYAWVPYLRYVGLNGSMARGEETASSDIDLMVVTEQGHIFTVRFIMVCILSIIGIKRSSKKISGKLCVNYFTTLDNLDIKPHILRSAKSHKYQVSLIDSEGLFGNKYKNIHSALMAKNRWLNNFRVTSYARQKYIGASIKPLVEPWQTIRLVLEVFLFPVSDVLEIVLRYFQKVKISKHSLTKLNSERIVVSDKELRFHPSKTKRNA